MGATTKRRPMGKDPRIHPAVRIYVLPNGRMPERGSDGAVAFDVFVRAIVAPHLEPNTPLRKTVFDFREKPSGFNGYVRLHRPNREGPEVLAYMLPPKDSIIVGVGFIVEMPFPLCYLVLPKSGLSTVQDIHIINAPAPVDSDYRGEAGVRLENRSINPFPIYQGQAIAQILFTRAIMPDFVRKEHYLDLAPSLRGAHGFGSTTSR